jgi:hypothetical protein
MDSYRWGEKIQLWSLKNRNKNFKSSYSFRLMDTDIGMRIKTLKANDHEIVKEVHGK